MTIPFAAAQKQIAVASFLSNLSPLKNRLQNGSFIVLALPPSVSSSASASTSVRPSVSRPSMSPLESPEDVLTSKLSGKKGNLVKYTQIPVNTT